MLNLLNIALRAITKEGKPAPFPGKAKVRWYIHYNYGVRVYLGKPSCQAFRLAFKVARDKAHDVSLTEFDRKEPFTTLALTPAGHILYAHGCTERWAAYHGKIPLVSFYSDKYKKKGGKVNDLGRRKAKIAGAVYRARHRG